MDSRTLLTTMPPVTSAPSGIARERQNATTGAKERLPKACLTFAGGGGMYNYSLGVLAEIQQHFDLTDVAIAASSSGVWPAMVATLGLDAAQLMESWNIPILEKSGQHRFEACGVWNTIVRKGSREHFPKDAYKTASGKLYIQMTECLGSCCAWTRYLL